MSFFFTRIVFVRYLWGKGDLVGRYDEQPGEFVGYVPAEGENEYAKLNPTH
jgi:hypothetical protein